MTHAETLSISAWTTDDRLEGGRDFCPPFLRSVAAAVSEPDPGRVLILTASEIHASILIGILRPTGNLAAPVVRVSPWHDGLCAEADDVVVVDVTAGAGEGLAWGVRCLSRHPSAEVVFISNEGEAPELAAARALGISRLVSGPGAHAWLAAAAPALIRSAQARRALQAATAAIPALPSTAASTETAPRVPLPVAEGRFRESYLRALLATTNSRVHAASRAGIPYRTLCKILQTLDIDLSHDR